MAGVRKATKADTPALAAVLARAFADDPVMGWLFPHDRADQRRMRALFALELDRHYLENEAVYTTDDLCGGALWAPPHRWKLGWRAILRDLPSLGRIFGRRSVTAMTALSAIEKRHPTEPHWYLATLGTAPERQGHGVGTSLMAPVLERCDEEGLPAYLESSKERNVPFYRRHGFEVTERFELPKGPPLWLMWREPRWDGGAARASAS